MPAMEEVELLWWPVAAAAPSVVEMGSVSYFVCGNKCDQWTRLSDNAFGRESFPSSAPANP
jgi:hypothetical protein